MPEKLCPQNATFILYSFYTICLSSRFPSQLINVILDNLVSFLSTSPPYKDMLTIVVLLTHVGSILVSFKLTSNGWNNVAQLAQMLMTGVQTGQLTLTSLEGDNLVIDPASFWAEVVQNPATTTIPVSQSTTQTG